MTHTPRRSRPGFLSRHAPLAAAIAGVLAAPQAFAACVPNPQAIDPDPLVTAPVYCVTNTNTSGPGSLEQAITDSHYRCGGTSPTIGFDLGGTGPFVFTSPSSGFSFYCGALGAFNPTIDGTTQTGSSPNSDPAGFNAEIQIVISGAGSAQSGVSFSGFDYGGRLTVKGIGFRDFYNPSYAGPCGSASPAALSGQVTVLGSRFESSCYGVIFEREDTDGSQGSGTTFLPSLIGGPGFADRNVFGGMFLDAIINTSYGGSATIENNFIGTLNGTSSGGGTGKGIYLYGDGTKHVHGNVISGNNGPAGIYLWVAASTIIKNNRIGMAADGSQLGNAQDGITSESTYDIEIKDNVIAYNLRDGVNVLDGMGVEITGNSIFGNGRKAINLGDSALQVPNDPGDSDEGANGLQNFPDITSVIQDATANQTTINWQLDSAANSQFALQFFSNPVAGTVPQAQTLIGGVTVFTPAASTFTFGSTSFPGLHDFITATATDEFGSTSEVGSQALAKGVALSPTSINFGNVVVGDTSPSQVATLTSLGAQPANISRISSEALCYGGPAPICEPTQFDCTTTCTSGTFGTSCSFSASFSPIAVGPQSTTIYICDDAGGNPRTLTLTASGVPPPPATVAPTVHDFGAVEVGGTSASQAFSINNPSPLSTSLTPVTVTPPFQILTNSCGPSLPALGSCTVTLNYAPTGVGPSTGSLTASAGTGPMSALLGGTGTAGPPPTFLPASLDFGPVQVGTASAFATFTLHNPALTSVPVGSFTVTPPFMLGTVACANPLPPGGNCTAEVKFEPSAPGLVSGTISVPAAGGTFSSTLSGTGTATPTLSISPPAHNFGSVLVGNSSPAKTFSIMNPSPVSTSLSVLTSAPFTVVGTTCGTTLAANSSCIANVTFVPTEAGLASAALSATSSSGSSFASLSGVGTRQPAVSVPTSPIEFGSLLVNSAPVQQTLQLSNPGNDVLGINSIAVTPPFSLSTTCGASLSPSGTCNITVGFNPLSVGDFGGFLSISTNAPGGTFLQAPVHAGVQRSPEPIVRVSPAAINFGARFAGSPGPTQNVTVSNEGGSAANLAVALNMPHFTIISSGCGASLAPGASCNIELGFSPQGFGPRRGSLVITANAAGSPYSVSLSGAGCRPLTTPPNRGGPAINCSP